MGLSLTSTEITGGAPLLTLFEKWLAGQPAVWGFARCVILPPVMWPTRLINKMNKDFSHDAVFQKGIKKLLKDSVAQTIERLHLKPSRHAAVFHFDPEAFAKTMAKAKFDECLFVSARGKKNRDLHFAFADVLAAEIHVGLPSDHAGFDAMLSKTGNDMANLVIRFSDEANSLIVHYLVGWGFKRS